MNFPSYRYSSDVLKESIIVQWRRGLSWLVQLRYNNANLSAVADMTMDCLSNHKNGTTLNIFHNTQKIPSPWRPIRTVSASYLINISTSTAPTQPKLGHMQPLVLFTIRPNYYALSTLFLALRILFWHAYRSIPISHPKNIVI